jgi:hypothetical protein
VLAVRLDVIQSEFGRSMRCIGREGSALNQTGDRNRSAGAGMIRDKVECGEAQFRNGAGWEAEEEMDAVMRRSSAHMAGRQEEHHEVEESRADAVAKHSGARERGAIGEIGGQKRREWTMLRSAVTRAQQGGDQRSMEGGGGGNGCCTEAQRNARRREARGATERWRRQ